MTDSSHGFTDEDLLAFVHGIAPKDLTTRIEDAQAQDQMLAAEIALMRGLKPALANASDALNPPGELDWRRLKADIEKESRPAVATTAPRSGRVLYWQAAAVFFALIAVGQIGHSLWSSDTTEPVYQTATGSDADHVLIIGFAPNASASEISEMLRSANARVIDGPAASGLYSIAFETEEAMVAGRQQFEDAAFIETVLDP